MLATQKGVSLYHALAERMGEARQRSDELFSMVRADALYERPIPERHRIIFYLGHLEAFDWNLLHESILGRKSFHPEFDRLFAFGVDPVGADHALWNGRVFADTAMNLCSVPGGPWSMSVSSSVGRQVLIVGVISTSTCEKTSRAKARRMGPRRDKASM